MQNTVELNSIFTWCHVHCLDFDQFHVSQEIVLSLMENLILLAMSKV